MGAAGRARGRAWRRLGCRRWLGPAPSRARRRGSLRLPSCACHLITTESSASRQEAREVNGDLGPPVPSLLTVSVLVSPELSHCPGGLRPPISLARGSGQPHGLPSPHHAQKEEAVASLGAHAHSPYPHSACGGLRGDQHGPGKAEYLPTRWNVRSGGQTGRDREGGACNTSMTRPRLRARPGTGGSLHPPLAKTACPKFPWTLR